MNEKQGTENSKTEEIKTETGAAQSACNGLLVLIDSINDKKAVVNIPANIFAGLIACLAMHRDNIVWNTLFNDLRPYATPEVKELIKQLHAVFEVYFS